MEIKTLINQLKDNPNLLYSLKPREFEELIAEIFAGLGWNVNLTKQSREGGFDIFAISTDKADIKTAWIIECKNYKKEHKVGVEQVRQLDYIKTTLNIPNAILATTSSFSTGALQIANSRYDITLIDSSDIIQRVNRYVPPPPEKESYIANRNFYSFFISYSHKDQEFSNLLYTELKKRNVEVWYAPEDLHPGKKINEEVTNAIKIFDKLLIVLSENSIKVSGYKLKFEKAERENSKKAFEYFSQLAWCHFPQYKNGSYLMQIMGKI